MTKGNDIWRQYRDVVNPGTAPNDRVKTVTAWLNGSVSSRSLCSFSLARSCWRHWGSIQTQFGGAILNIPARVTRVRKFQNGRWRRRTEASWKPMFHEELNTLVLQCFLLSLSSIKVPSNFAQRNPSQLGCFVRNVKADLDELMDWCRERFRRIKVIRRFLESNSRLKAADHINIFDDGIVAECCRQFRVEVERLYERNKGHCWFARWVYDTWWIYVKGEGTPGSSINEQHNNRDKDISNAVKVRTTLNDKVDKW